MQNDGVSILVPFLNEEDSILIFCKTIDEYVKTNSFKVELVFINDGSSDDTAEKIRQYHFFNICAVKLIELSKNFGSHAALRAGLVHASFDICTWLSCDLQEPLEIINIAYEKISKQKFDAVYFEKKSVKVSSLERLFSKTYSSLMQKYAVKNYGSGGTTTIAFNGKIKKLLNDNIESNSSIMLQIIDSGFKYCNVKLDYGARITGTSKWTFAKKIKLFIDSFVAFSFMPIRLVSIVGFIIFFVGIAVGLATIISKIVHPELPPLGYPTLVSILALGFGITNISLGIIAEYLWRTYDAARKRPVFIISDVENVK